MKGNINGTSIPTKGFIFILHKRRTSIKCNNYLRKSVWYIYLMIILIAYPPILATYKIQMELVPVISEKSLPLLHMYVPIYLNP